MSELCREVFEKHQAKLLNIDYQELKNQFDRHEKCFSKRYATFSDFEKEFELWKAAWGVRQAEIDQLNVKNNQLTHALVNTNAEKAKWAKDYWSQVERSAEYGAMLMTDTDSLEFKCFQKEKKIEELAKQLLLCREENKGLVGKVSEQKKRVEETCKSIDSFFDDQVGTPTQREYCNFISEIKQDLRGVNDINLTR